MKRFRHRPMGTRLAILAVIGLLWSQLVLAAHPLCPTAAMAMPEMALATAGAGDGCHHEEVLPTDKTLCASHCSQGDQNSDVKRVPVIPALPPATPVAIASFVFLPTDPVPHPAMPLPVSWHRPTAHPAAVLLI